MVRFIRSGLALTMLLGFLLPVDGRNHRASAQTLLPRVVEVTATSVVFELDVPLPAIEEVQGEGRAFQRISLPGYTSGGATGEPELPRTSVVLGIPAEGEIELRVLEAKAEDLPGAYAVYPNPDWVMQPDARTGQADPVAGVQEQFAWDAEAYGRDIFEPQAVAVVDEVATVRNQRVARVLLQPVQYNPVQGKLRVSRYLRVEAIFHGAQPDGAPFPTAPDVFDPLLQAQLLNFDQALAWRIPREQPVAGGDAPAVTYPGDTSRAWFKTTLRYSGLYQVTRAELQGSALAPLVNANPAYLQVWKNGQQVPAYFMGDGDAQFESGEALLFYAHVEPTIYSETDVYWLSVGDQPGLRMEVRNAAPEGVAGETADWVTAHVEEDFIFRSDLPGYGAPVQYPRWYWADLRRLDSLTVPSRTVHAVLPQAITSGYTATLRVRLMGSSSASANPDHRVRVDLNGATAGIISWDGIAPAQAEFQVPATWLLRGINAVTLTVEDLPGVSTDWSFLDWFEIDYRQALDTVNGRLAFTADGVGRRDYQVRAVGGAVVLALDVANPTAPVFLTGLQTTPVAAAPESGEGAAPASAATTGSGRIFLPMIGFPRSTSSPTYHVRFGETSTSARSYAIADVAQLSRVPTISRDTGSALRSATNRADYLLISHRDLWPAAQALANHRRNRGLTVALVDVQDVYDEFSNGRLDPRAMRDFVALAYSSWQAPAPGYLLLLGGGHYDYRMRTGLTSSPNLVPPYFACVDPWLCEVAVDNEFVAVSGNDRLPDLAIGRLPAKTLDAAWVMVNKIISYETTPPPGAWAGTLAFVADNYRDASGAPDPAGNFEALNEGVIALVPPQYTARRLYFDPYPDDDNGEPYRYRTPETTTDAIINTVNSGVVFLNYVGHAGTTTWAHEAILRARDVGRNDVERFANGPRQPIVLDMACLSGNFADPTATGIEVMMLKRTPGGSIAGWGATGFGVATGHDWLHRSFYQAVFNGGIRNLGLATAAGKQGLWAVGLYRDLIDTFDLLGDPALRINLQPAVN